MNNVYVNLKNQAIVGQRVFDLDFDLAKLVEVQKQIVTKYEPVEDLMFENLGSKGFITMFDKYILHCIEEVAEVRDAIVRGKQAKLRDEEIVDILLYLGSMNAILDYNMKRYQLPTQDKIEIVGVSPYNHFTQEARGFLQRIVTVVPVTIDMKLIEVVQQLMEQRQLFPQRKWHKESSEDSEIQFKFKLRDMYAKNCEAIKVVLGLLCEIADCNPVYLNSLICEKQKLVLELPMPE